MVEAFVVEGKNITLGWQSSKLFGTLGLVIRGWDLLPAFRLLVVRILDAKLNLREGSVEFFTVDDVGISGLSLVKSTHTWEFGN